MHAPLGRDFVEFKRRIEARKVERPRAAIAAEEVSLAVTGLAIVVIGL